MTEFGCDQETAEAFLRQFGGVGGALKDVGEATQAFVEELAVLAETKELAPSEVSSFGVLVQSLEEVGQQWEKLVEFLPRVFVES